MRTETSARWPLLRIKVAVYGRTLSVIDAPQATAVGAALLGGLAAGLWPDLAAALNAVAQPQRTVAPDEQWMPRYAALFEEIYRGTYAALAPLNHALTRFDAGSPPNDGEVMQ